jgi:hypothetical protein
VQRTPRPHRLVSTTLALGLAALFLASCGQFDPLSEMREIVASEALIPSQRLGLIGDPDEEYTRLLAVQLRAANATTRNDDSHRRAYEALDRSIRAWILISEASPVGADYAALSDDIEQSLAMLYRAADHHEAACGPPDGVLFAAGELE